MIITKDEQMMLLKIIQERNKESKATLMSKPFTNESDADYHSRNYKALDEFEILTTIKAKLCVEVCK